VTAGHPTRTPLLLLSRRRLGVKTILGGSVRSAGERIRISAQLIDVKTGFHLWSEKYDRILNDVFEVQDDIAKTILEKLQITLNNVSEQTFSREQTHNVQAYQLYLKGRALLYKRDKYLFKSISLFEEALQIDPTYALAYAGLADAHTIICYFGLLPPKLNWPKAIAYAKKATQYGPNLAETHNCNAEISILHEWNWEKGRQQYIRAIELNPGYEQARGWYALFYLQLAFERHDEAIEQINNALDVNPISFYSNTIMGLCYGIAGQHEKAIEKAKKGLSLEPNSYITQCYLGCVLHWAGKFQEAETSFNNALALSGRHSYALGFLAINYIDWGKKERALELYEELVSKSAQKFIHPSLIAMVAAALEKKDEASKYIELAFDEHDPLLHIAAKCFPDAKALRELPGHQNLIRKMGLLDAEESTFHTI
jgi:tetratricopeptide (TPR) repeat protein